jgi:hypothetical protein
VSFEQIVPAISLIARLILVLPAFLRTNSKLNSHKLLKKKENWEDQAEQLLEWSSALDFLSSSVIYGNLILN